NYQEALRLATGASASAGDGDGTATVHGSRDVDVVTLVDGVSTPDPLAGKSGAQVNTESIQEIEVKTAGATADYGRAQGGLAKRESAKTFPGVIVRIAAPRSDYQAGDVIELSVTIENQSGKAIQVPAALSVADGTARFRVLDLQGIAAADPVSQPGMARMTTLAPGARATLKVQLNGRGGYRLVRPGEYHVTLLGASLGLGDSNTLTLRIRP